MFRHSSIYVRRDRGIACPSDLRGKRVGIPEWAQTAGIYVRGILQDHYSVRPSEIEWVQAGIYKSGREEEVVVTPPPGVTVQRTASDTLSDMFDRGSIDAVISAHPPRGIVAGDPGLGRLFEDPGEAERAYWQTTGVFPIMHVVLLRKDVFDSHPFVAMNMLSAFEEAKTRSMMRAVEMTASRYAIPWLGDHVRRIREWMGEDYWPYGVEKNRRVLDTFLRYAFEQGVTGLKLSVDDLFPPEVRTSYAI
jgi:4,5-dihydroxyphthalate decarboxylase